MQVVYRDYEELLRLLNAEGIKYLVVGAYAVMFYTEPRWTKDIDIWIDPSAPNAKKVWKVLKKFGAPVNSDGLTVEDLTNPVMVYQVGIPPVRIDILMNIGDISFSEAWGHKQSAPFGKEMINIIGLNDLIKAKTSAARRKDKDDIAKLKKRLKVKK
jgi:predicted nucleotidyltransferase